MLGMSVQARWLLGIAVIGVNILSGDRGLAQITPDGTLPNNSVVAPNGSTFNITGGTLSGANLFHSFKEFSVPTGGTAFFNNGVDIQNIISRVTGGSISNIDGLIRTLGSANLFVINPNGIIFGPNASLNVGGSFVASSASALQFGNQGFFSATNPDTPALLTINPSALFFNQLTIPGISNSSVAPAGLNPIGVKVTGLRVPDGKSLLLVGGDVNINGGSLRAYGGRVELAAIIAPTEVGLDVGQNTLTIRIPEDAQRANVSLSNGAEINVRAQDGGSIAINAQNVNLAGGSKLRAGIETGLGTQQSKAGDIEINAKGETVLSDGSLIANVVNSQATGQGGNIKITTGALTLSGAYLNTTTFGQGNGGSVSVVSSGPVSLVGGKIFTGPDTGGVGNGGNISISAGSVTLTSGSNLDAASYGLGNGGNITINARDTVAFDGVDDSNGIPTGARTALLDSGEGIAGDIKITTGSLFLSNGASIFSDTFGKGNGGSITINARDTVSVDGSSSVSSDVGKLAVGNGGDIRVTTGSLSVTNGAQLSSNVLGQGNAGNITIDARDTVKLDGIVGNAIAGIQSELLIGAAGKGGDIFVTTGTLSVTNGAQLSSNALGQGNAGNITIDARDTIKLDGIVGNAIAGIQSNSFSEVGKGGDILVLTGSLSVTNGAQLSAYTSGRGNAGNITINARDTVTFDGVGNINASDTVTFDGVGYNKFPLSSGAYTDVGSNDYGNGGDIRVSARELLLKNGGQLSTSSFGQGKAGNIQINVSDTVTFDGSINGFVGSGSGAKTIATENSSKAGDIFVTTGTLSLTNGGILTATAETFAGNITINARDAVIFDGTNDKRGLPSGANSLLLDGSPGKAGDIKVTTGSLTVRNGAVVISSTFGKGDAGNVIIDARGRVSFDGTSSDALSTVEQTGVGKGGDIRIS
ncbi:MAG: filamentous hemagglutinin N-terminal domain-containing protein, partial [Stigonema ocellatum SAG 48.90 = DSM 106950]|nr:filamentous hemagglutinin N-terminal domain-containing protein [Stigonema ocellatum SAG 48.90 = DSM 106950]